MNKTEALRRMSSDARGIISLIGAQEIVDALELKLNDDVIETTEDFEHQRAIVTSEPKEKIVSIDRLAISLARQVDSNWTPTPSPYMGAGFSAQHRTDDAMKILNHVIKP